jgi:pSer/pThr/pTyr-binding forkhead associated (FHA) protein
MVGAGGEYLIEDLASTNGTYVNGVRVQAPVALSPGDMIDLGTTRLVVRGAPRPVAAESPVDARAETMLGIPALREPEPEPEPLPEPPAATAPTLELRLSIDIAAAEAEVALADGGEPVRLRLEEGRWHIVRDA